MITFGLVGHPLGHSFSQAFFTTKFKNEDIDAQYLNFDVDRLDEINGILESNSTLAGFNVTIPYKLEVMKMLDAVSSEAAAIGAVNVVKVSREGGKTTLAGFNTDVIGFRDSLKPYLRADIKKALVLGTGGASRAVTYALDSLGIKWESVSRSKDKGEFTYRDLDEAAVASHKLIVNTTPLGTWPDVVSYPPIPYDGISAEHVCFDLVYNPPMTEFLRRSAERGAVAVNGLGMLHGQAEAAWKIWTE